MYTSLKNENNRLPNSITSDVTQQDFNGPDTGVLVPRSSKRPPDSVREQLTQAQWNTSSNQAGSSRPTTAQSPATGPVSMGFQEKVAMIRQSHVGQWRYQLQDNPELFIERKLNAESEEDRLHEDIEMLEQKLRQIDFELLGPKSRTATAVSTARRGTVAVIGAMTGNTIADAIFGRRPTKAGQNPSDTSAPFADRQSQQTQRRQISTNKSAPSPPTTASPLLLTQTRHQGRKPMRQIAAEIADKIKTLETNHLEFEVLLTKIQTYREEELNASARRDIVQKNKKIMEKYRVDLRSEITHEKLTKREQHRIQLLEWKKEHDEEVKHHKQEVIRMKQQRIEQEQRHRLQVAEENSYMQFFKKWFILIIVGSRIHTMQYALMEDQIREIERIRYFSAAKTIQVAWRTYNRQRKARMRADAMMALTRAFRLFIPRLRIRMRHRAASMLIDSLKEVQNTNRLLKVIRQYRYNVIQCQRIVRGYIQIRHAQLQLLILQWDCYAPIWWQKRITPTSVPDGEDGKKRRPRSKKAASRASAPTQEPSTTFHIPESIKIRLLREILLRKRKHHRITTKEYQTKLHAWYRNYKRRKEAMNKLHGSLTDTHNVDTDTVKMNKEVKDIAADGLEMNAKTGMPVVKMMRVLLTSDEMTSLIEHGFLEATGHFQQSVQ